MNIEEIQEFIRNHSAVVKFNDGTEAKLPIYSIKGTSVAVYSRKFIKQNNIKNPYPYEIIKIVD